ncbi:heme biosynthesis protein HemY [Chelatococcus asaccharovorans]|uniref:heme biosynthesis protein HemY n=1 Tax=Chelatococcus asaccharovorans TaxID=28210 RepID=UPI00224C6E7C|nr:heme biosynthesis HemY N-terminal domain-containing protein [Chelatococcus asaccharovorans]CAH1660058.1 Homolog of E. coli HemY protein [Chelatococcus asaccharovorans]CAH1683953.1 Homolog of E. coli HemY protein [Chelatococcus asaccharovorans]
MIRVLVFLAVLALVALGASWLADRPGEVAVIWQGYRIETSVAVLMAAMLAVAFLLVCLWSLLRLILRLPSVMSFASRARRRNRGYVAVSRGMVAVGAGDPLAARRHASDAERWLGREPLTLLLKAQAAQISGDRAGAEATFTEMLDDAETRVLGLRGLFVEARRKGDAIAARAYVNKAVELAPGVAWASEAMLEFQSAERDWRGALAKLEQRVAHRSIDKATAKRQRAVLLTADALDRADKEPETALAAALAAVKLAPDLVPASALAGRLLAANGKLRKAAKVLEANWKIEPHPDIAAAYLDLRHGDSTHDRLARAETLARLKPRHPEATLAVAEAAIAAHEYAKAKQVLAPLLAERPTVRACLLMADIEEAEHGASPALRQWLGKAARAPRDAVWMADGVTSDRWEPVSPISGRLDAFQWVAPAEQIAHGRVHRDADAVLADGDEPTVLLPAALDQGQESGDASPAPASDVSSPVPPGAPTPLAPAPPTAAPSAPSASSPLAKAGVPSSEPMAKPAEQGSPSVSPEPSFGERDSEAPRGVTPQAMESEAKELEARASEAKGTDLKIADAKPAGVGTSAEKPEASTKRAAGPVVFPVARPPDDPGTDEFSPDDPRAGDRHPFMTRL